MKRGFALFAICFLAVFAVGVGQAMAVDVYAEGAYTDTDLVVYIYADIGPSETPLRSAGVKLTYETSELQNPSAVKNETEWYLGNESYMEPEVGTPGEVVFILGKLNTDYPGDGVPDPSRANGDRVLLGTVTFERKGPAISVLGLEYGKLGDWDDDKGEYTFKNFVDTAQNVLDDPNGGVVFDHPDFSPGDVPVVVKRRGDANGDEYITRADMGAIRSLIGGAYKCFADCNNDGYITRADMGCVRGLL